MRGDAPDMACMSDIAIAKAKPTLAQRPIAVVGLAVAGVLLLALFLALGVWQIERRAWKLALIASVEARIHRAAVAAPPHEAWPDVTFAADEYRRVRVTGTYLDGPDTFVHALTALGAGYWCLAPLRTDAGDVVLINRGFVALDARDTIAPPRGRAAVVGLLRMSEPGHLLWHNDPAAESWFARDVAEIAAARGLHDVAPFFVDADSDADGPNAPVGGLTVVDFPNNHLSYALTWFALAALVAGAGGWGAWTMIARRG